MNSDKTIAMGKISYINASPVYYGLDHGLLPSWLKMITDVPSALNRQIMTGEIQVSPISSAFYAMNHEELLLLPDLSISCHGRVLSVILASRLPIDELTGKRVLFSQESASAASFLKMIFRKRGVKPVYETGPVTDCMLHAQDMDAVLVIGDAALTQTWDKAYEYCIDLGQLWYEMTKLPFVFAVWAIRRSYALKHPDTAKKIHQLLLSSKREGEKHTDEVIEIGREKTGLEESVVRKYFDLLHCGLDQDKIKAMEVFFESLFDQGILNQKARIEFFTS